MQVSKTIEGNGLLPKWNFNVNCLVWDPRLCFVRFAVFTQRRMRRPLLLAYEVVPVACLRQGYRAVPLRAPSGSFIADCALFVFISRKQIECDPSLPPQGSRQGSTISERKFSLTTSGRQPSALSTSES